MIGKRTSTCRIVETETANQGRDEPGRKRRVLPHTRWEGTESEVDEWAEREQYKRYTPCEKQRITDETYKMRRMADTRGIEAGDHGQHAGLVNMGERTHQARST